MNEQYERAEYISHACQTYKGEMLIDYLVANLEDMVEESPGAPLPPCPPGAEKDIPCPHRQLAKNKDGETVCTQCGLVKVHDLNLVAPYGSGPGARYEYQRVTYFRECLNQKQGLQNTSISRKVLERIEEEMDKYGYDRKTLTPEKLKYILKKIRYSKHYEHVNLIVAYYTEQPILELDEETEARLFQMFMEIQKPFEQVKPPTRKSFLSYQFVIHKFLQLLGKDEEAQQFKLLKSIDKLKRQDKIWKDICEITGYTFIPSI